MTDLFPTEETAPPAHVKARRRLDALESDPSATRDEIEAARAECAQLEALLLR